MATVAKQRAAGDLGAIQSSDPQIQEPTHHITPKPQETTELKQNNQEMGNEMKKTRGK